MRPTKREKKPAPQLPTANKPLEVGHRLEHADGSKASVVLIDRKTGEVLIYIEGQAPGKGYEVLQGSNPFATRNWRLT